jgi:hypothetical protein
MTWNSAMGFVSSVALFLPIAFILALKLGRYRSFPALLAYYAIAFINNILGEGYIAAGTDVVKYWGLANNLLHPPLMLFFLTYLCTSVAQAQRMRMLILTFILFEVVVILLRGISKETITITLAPGLAIIFFFCGYFFIRQTKMAITHRKATGKAMIVASQLFAHGCFAIIYLMFYVFETHRVGNEINPGYLADIYLVYFFVVTLSSSFMCAGIIIESKRVQKLSELKITRKELLMIYDGTEKAAPLRTAILDFDKDQWN